MKNEDFLTEMLFIYLNSEPEVTDRLNQDSFLFIWFFFTDIFIKHYLRIHLNMPIANYKLQIAYNLYKSYH